MISQESGLTSFDIPTRSSTGSTTSQLFEQKYRVQTFKHYPQSAEKSALQLAENGFIYIGNGHDNTVKCVFCDIELVNWPNDVTIGENHLLRSPECPLLRNAQSNNKIYVPKVCGGETFDQTFWKVNSSNAESSNPTCPTSRCVGSIQTSVLDATCSELGLITEKPKSPNFASLEKRMQSFRQWPESNPMKVEDLVEAGFHHISGRGDTVCCFYCGGSLNNWEVGDDPWIEHIRAYPKCGFLAIHQGQKPSTIISSSEPVQGRSLATEPSLSSRIRTTELRNHTVVRAARSMGYQEDTVLTRAGYLRDRGELTVERLFESLNVEDEPQRTQRVQYTPEDNASGANWSRRHHQQQLDDQGLQISNTPAPRRTESLCRSCRQRSASLMTLPCQHLVCCIPCVLGRPDCFICRREAEAYIRAHII